MKKSLLLLSVLVFSFCALWAQTKISGIVTDAGNGAPIGYGHRCREGNGGRRHDRCERRIYDSHSERDAERYADVQLRRLRPAGGRRGQSHENRHSVKELIRRYRRGRRHRLSEPQEADLYRFVGQAERVRPERGRYVGHQPYAGRQGGRRIGAERVGYVRCRAQGAYSRRRVDHRRQQAAVGRRRCGAGGYGERVERPALERRPDDVAGLFGGRYQCRGHRDVRHSEGCRRYGHVRSPAR